MFLKKLYKDFVVAYETYLSDLGCPATIEKRTQQLEWIVDYANYLNKMDERKQNLFNLKLENIDRIDLILKIPERSRIIRNYT